MIQKIRPMLIGLLAGIACGSGWAQIQLAGVTEATGSGAPAGGSFKNGYLMAIEEVNASGGVLGQKLVLTQFDIDTKADAAVDAIKKAVAAKPFAILGPVFSGLTLAAMKETADTRIPHFTGGEAASLTRKFHPSLMRTSLSQLGSVPRLGALAIHGLDAKKIGLIWIDNEFGRDGKITLAKTIKQRNATIVFDEAIKPGQTDFSQSVTNLKTVQVDALLLYATEIESIVVLKELKKQGFNKPIVSEGLVASQKVIEGSEGAAEGVLAHMNIFTGAPLTQMQTFAKRYTQKYGIKPDQNSVKGFFTVQLIKAGLEQTAKPDQIKFLDIVKNTHFDNKRFPELISSVSYDFFGDLNRESYFVVIRNNQPNILATIRSIDGGYVELPNGRQITLNSNEFRQELRNGLTTSNAQIGKK